jgi:hypothetical protein
VVRALWRVQKDGRRQRVRWEPSRRGRRPIERGNVKKIVQDVPNEGLEKLIGEKVLLLCANYYYCGKLEGVSEDCVLLSEPQIVYLTGEWSAKKYELAEALPAEQWYVQRSFIESFGKSK